MKGLVEDAVGLENGGTGGDGRLSLRLELTAAKGPGGNMASAFGAVEAKAADVSCPLSNSIVPLRVTFSDPYAP